MCPVQPVLGWTHAITLNRYRDGQRNASFCDVVVLETIVSVEVERLCVRMSGCFTHD